MLDDQAIKALLLRTAARDDGAADAFRRLYELCAPLLLGVAQRIVGRRELAEEVLHDAFAKIWRSVDTFDPLAAQPVAWMAAIVRNRAIDVRSSHDVARVDSYHATLDDDPDGSLDRLFDWSPRGRRRRGPAPRRAMAARLPFAPRRGRAPVAGARLPARPVAQRAGGAPEEAARHGEELGAPRHEQPARCASRPA